MPYQVLLISLQVCKLQKLFLDDVGPLAYDPFMNGNYVFLAEIFKLFSHPTRLAILGTLQQGELPVQQIAKKLGLSDVTLAPHLGRLRRLKFIRAQRKAGQAYYRMTDPKIFDAIKIIEQFERDSR